MLSPVNDRFSGLSNIMHLTKDESHKLNQSIIDIASLQIQQKNKPLNINDLPQSKIGFLKIHAKIEQLKTSGKLTATEVKFLDKINSVARNFEQVVLQSLSTGNARDLAEVEELCNILNKLNQDPLLQDKINPELRKELESLTEKMRSVAENYRDVYVVHKKLESHEHTTELAIESLAAQQKALEQGEAVFSIDSDLTLLELFDQLIGFYKNYEHKESLPLYHAELIERLTQEAYALRFNREDFCTEYQAAVEVEVLKTLQNLHRETSTDGGTEPEEEYEALLLELIEAKNKIEMAKATLDSHVESLNQPEKATEKLFKEFAALHDQLEGDLDFLESQIKILSEKQTIGLFGRMKIYNRGRSVERNVRAMKEMEEDVPKGWGHKLLSAAMWGLYLTPQIGALAQFASRTYQAVSTGESPLKETADLMSNAAFAKQIGELPPEEQQEIDFDVSTIQGVLNGYIPLTEALAENRPEAAEYLEVIETKSATIPGSHILNPAAGNNHIPTPILSSKEADVHALRYMGSQVREHYEATGKQLVWENPLGSFGEHPLGYTAPEEKPRSMFSLFGEECANSIREAKTGVPLEENAHYEKLQDHVQSIFGIKLPVEWFSEWILTQSWSDERLDNFEDWFAHNLECQVRHHISKQDIHVKSDADANIPLLLAGATSAESSGKSQFVKRETKSLTAESRKFEGIQGLGDRIYPGSEIFREPEPLTSAASRLTSPFKIVFDTYRFFVNTFRSLLGSAPAPVMTSEKTLLHLFGDFFGQSTGLEGHSQIEAFKFYRDLITSIIEDEWDSAGLYQMRARLEQAIDLSQLLTADIDRFRNQLKIELERLDPGKSVFMAGGWAGSPSGHALIYEVIRQDDGGLTFRLYNTGAGIAKYHVVETVDLKDKVVPYVEISNVSLEKMLARPFLKAWQNLKTEIPTSYQWNADDVYDGLLSHLEGEASTVIYGKEDLMTPQRSGTCIFMSLQVLFYHFNVDKSVSQKIRFKLLAEGFKNYVISNKETLSFSSRSLNLFSKSLEEFSRIATEMHAKEIIDDKELYEASKQIKEYRQILKAEKQVYLRETEKNATVLDLKTSAPAWDSEISLAGNLLLDPDKLIPPEKVPLVYLPGLKNWQPKQETFLADLTLYVDAFKKGTIEKSHLSVLQNVQTFVQKLDLAKMEFSKEETSKIVAQLHALGFLYYENIQRSCSQHPDSHCQFVTPNMLLTVNTILHQTVNLLERHYPGVPGKIVFSPLNRYSDRVLENELMRFMKPEQDVQFRKIDGNAFNMEGNYIHVHTHEKLLQGEQFGIVSAPYEAIIGGVLSPYRINSTHWEYPINDGHLFDKFFFTDTVKYEGKYITHARENYPSELYQIYDLGLLSLGLERLPISLTSFTSESPLYIETKFNAGGYNDHFAIFHGIKKLDKEYPEGMNYLGLARYHLSQTFPKFEDRKLQTVFEVKGDRSFLYNFKRQNEWLVKMPSEANFSLQTFRDLTGLATYRELTIKETLSYYSRHAGLFAKPDYQALFINLMFTPGLLLEELGKPHANLVAKHLYDLVVKNFAFYQSIGDLKTAAFILQLNRLFKDYVDYADIKSRPDFLDTRGEIRTLLSEGNVGAEARWLLNKEMALSYFHNADLTELETTELLKAVFAVNSYYNVGYNDEKWARLQIEELVMKHTDAFIKLSEGPNKHHLLNSLTEVVTGNAVNKEWKAAPSYPYFESTDGDYQINLASCKLVGDTIHGLPEEIAKHPDVQKIFSSDVPQSLIKTGINAYLATFEGNAYRLLQNKDEVVIQRGFEIKGKTIWGQYQKPNEELNFLPGMFAKGSKLWVYETNPTAILMTNEKNQVIARLEGNSIYQTNPQTGNDTGLILHKNKASPLSETLSKFEDPGYFAVWVDADSNLPQQIDFPRLGAAGISFVRQNIDGVDRMVSEAFPGFYLAEKQYVEDLQDDFAFLLLENASGAQQAILANQYFSEGGQSRKEEKKALETSTSYFERDVESPYLKTQNFFKYKLNSKTGKMEASSFAARLYLGMRFLLGMRYEEAETMLRGYDAFLRAYTDEEVEILKHIMDIEYASGDQDPRATALSLYAAYLLEKNRVDFGISVELEGASKLYSTYLNQLNNIYGVRLSQDEELLILNSIQGKTQSMVNRLLEFDPVKGKLAQAELSWRLSEDTVDEIENICPVTIDAIASIDDLMKVLEAQPKEVQALSMRMQYFSDSFTKAFELTQADVLTDNQKEFYKTFTGLDFPDQNGGWKNELAETLRFMTKTPYKESKTLAWLLLAALENPQDMPLRNAFKDGILDLNEFRENYQKTFIPKLLSIYPQVTEINTNPVFSFQKAENSEQTKLNTKATQNLHINNDYQHSIAVRSVSKIPELIPLNDLISAVPVKAEVSTASDLGELEKVFSKAAVKDPVVKHEMARITSSIKLYKDVAGKSETQLALKSLKDLNNYANKLSDALSNAETDLRDRENLLLGKINRPAKQYIERAKSELTDIGQSRQLLTVDDLIFLFWNRDAAKFHEANPDLTIDEIHELEAGIQAMLVQATHIQQMKRTFKHIELIKKDPDSAEHQEQLKQLKSSVESSHAYDIDAHPEYLVIEHYADLLLRPDQIKNLDLLQIREGKIHDRKYLGAALEMIMGGGKTTILLPLLGILNADGDTLSIGIIPEALLPSMSGMLAEILGTGFKRSAEVVYIDRDTPINDAFLTRLQNIRHGKKLMLMTDSSLQSLYLNYIECLHDYSNASKEERVDLGPKLMIFKEVFTVLKQKGSVIIDEVDQILNPRTEKQFTLGSANPLPVHEIELVTALYKLLETDPIITGLMRFEFSSKPLSEDNEEEQQVFIAQKFDAQIKPRLIEAIIEKKLGVQDQETIRFFENLNADQLKLVKEYLSSQSTESVAFVSRQSFVVKDLLALAGEQVRNLLPLTCGKVSNQNYGFGDKADYAIPFHGSDVPSLKSQCGSAYETLDYTNQMVIKNGVNPKIVARELEILRNEAIQELKDNSQKLEETIAHQKFVVLTGEDKSFSLFESDAMAGKIAVKINADLELKLHFAEKYIAPNIKSYAKFLSANPQIYNYIFSDLNAFSGTQWNDATFVEGMEIIPDETIIGKTLGHLWKNRQAPVHVIKSSSSETIVSNLITANPQAKVANALIDAGGLIRGFSRLDAATQMSKSFQNDRPYIKGVIFYDENNELMVLEKGKTDPILLSASNLDPSELFTFYDQKHTTGSNIKQKPDAQAIVTIGRHTILRDLLQSVWRFRGLDKSQKVQFTIDEEVQEVIINTLKDIGISMDGPVLLEHIILFVAYNQAVLQGDNNYRALKHKTVAVVQEEMFKSFLDPSMDAEQVAELFKSVESLFIQTTSQSPWELFGSPAVKEEEGVLGRIYNYVASFFYKTEPEDPQAHLLEDSHVAAKKQAEKIKNSAAFQSLPEGAITAVVKELDRIVDKTIPLLPSKVTAASSIYGREMEAETEKEQEKEVEKEIEKEIDLSRKSYEPNKLLYTLNRIDLSKGFKETQGLESYADIFDPGLLADLNFMPIPEEIDDYYKVPNGPPFGLFNEFQKPVCALRIFSEDEVVMVDQSDAFSYSENRDTIFDLNLGLYRGEAPNFLNSDKFMRLVVQAKFFNGETHYKKEEIPLLQEWIKNKGAERMRKLFVNHILKFKDNSRAEFPGSVLDKALKAQV